MILWQVHWSTPDGRDSGEIIGPQVEWCATQAGARRVRRQLAAEHGFKVGDATIQQAEVPTRKAELVAWLNARDVECWK